MHTRYEYVVSIHIPHAFVNNSILSVSNAQLPDAHSQTFMEVIKENASFIVLNNNYNN